MESGNKKELLSEIINCLTQTEKNRHDVTFLETDEFSYIWEIKNFESYYFKENKENSLQFMESPIFKIGYNDISLKLHLETKDNNNFNLSVGSPTFINHPMRIKISIIGKNQREFSMVTENFQCIQPNTNYCNIGNLAKHFMEYNGLLSNGSLIIKCVICFQKKMVHNNLDNSNEINKLKHHLKKCKQFEKLLDSGKYSDVKLIVENKKFQVHKCILTMFSPVFATLFDDKNKQNDNIIEITDVKYEVMKEVLSYIYTGRINNFVMFAKDIIAAADKYGLEDLKKLCEEKLMH